MSEKCNSCGAEIEYAAGSQSLKCPYCGAANEIHKEEDQLPGAVEKIIPLTVSQDDLEKRVYGYMASGAYTPDDMLEAATFTKQECFYVPAFLFRVEYEATWTASFGYDRQEPYTAYRTVTRNNRSHQEAYTAYRTVTDWRPANGVDAGIVSVSTYAGKTLRDSALSPNDIVPFTIAKGGITNFNPSFMKGVQAESFVVPEASAFSSLKEEINSNIDRKVQSHGQGDHQKDWHWNAKMSHSTNTLYVPICHAVFDYQGVEYHVWIDGIGESEIRADKLPEDKDRKKLVYLGFVPAGVAIVGLIATSVIWAFTWGGLIAAALIGGYAAIRRKSIIGYSKEIRESLLTQIHASSSAMKEMTSEERDKLAKAFQRPEKPLFAKTHQDKAVLPALSMAALLGVGIPSYFASPGYLENSLRPSEMMAEPVQDLPEAAPVAVTAPVIPAPTEISAVVDALPAVTSAAVDAVPDAVPVEDTPVATSTDVTHIPEASEVSSKFKTDAMKSQVQRSDDVAQAQAPLMHKVAPHKAAAQQPSQGLANENPNAMLIQSTREEADTCMQQQNYDCAEANLKIILRLSPNDSESVVALQEIKQIREDAFKGDWNAK